MKDVPLDKIREFQDSFLSSMRASHKDVLDMLDSGKYDDSVGAVIERVAADAAAQYKAA